MSDEPTLSPYLVVDGARAALDFYRQAFGAVVGDLLVDPTDGRVGHAAFRLGGVTVMIADEYPDFGAIGPETLGGSPVRMHITVDDVDATFAGALALGAIEQRPVKDQFHGGRSGTLIDPFGHIWIVSALRGDGDVAESQARWNAMARQ